MLLGDVVNNIKNHTNMESNPQKRSKAVPPTHQEGKQYVAVKAGRISHSEDKCSKED